MSREPQSHLQLTDRQIELAVEMEFLPVSYIFHTILSR